MFISSLDRVDGPERIAERRPFDGLKAGKHPPNEEYERIRVPAHEFIRPPSRIWGGSGSLRRGKSDRLSPLSRSVPNFLDFLEGSSCHEPASKVSTNTYPVVSLAPPESRSCPGLVRGALAENLTRAAIHAGGRILARPGTGSAGSANQK